MIPRLLEKPLREALVAYNKVLLVTGARQVGKTTLVRSLAETEMPSFLYLNCDTEEDFKLLNTTSLTTLKRLGEKSRLLIVDEAQRLDNPGLTFKIIYDNIPNLRVLATGSSSFDLKNKLSDALTGRYLDFTLYPLSLSEIVNYETPGFDKRLNKTAADKAITSLLIYGGYPEVFLEADPKNKRLFLEKIVESYLFKDILAFHKVRHPQIIMDLAKALAYQIGCEVNENELSKRLGVDRKTVVSYLDILEKTFVIKRLRPFSSNLRREIGRSYKVYFVDLGIRNTLVGDFNDLNVRNDVGFLWENFLVMERLKKLSYQGDNCELRFWRNYGGAEVDLVESRSPEDLRAYEFKYKDPNLSRGVRSFQENYPKASVTLINSANYEDFIL